MGFFENALGQGISAAGLVNLADDISDTGDDIAQKANDYATQYQTGTQFKPFTVVTNTGNSSVGSDGSLTANLSLPQQGAVNAAMGNQMTALGNMGTGVSDAQRYYGRAAGGTAGQYLASLATPQAEREQGVYDRIRATQAPEEERQRQLMAQGLFARGRGGIQSSQYGGTPEQFAMEKAQAEARNQASLMAIQQSQAEQLQNSNIGQSLFNQSFLPQSQQQAYDTNYGQQADVLARLGLLPEENMLNGVTAGTNLSNLAQTGQIAGQNLGAQMNMDGLKSQLNSELIGANLVGQGFNALAGMGSSIGQNIDNSGGLGNWAADLAKDIFGIEGTA